MTKRCRITQIVAMLLVVGLIATTGLQAATNVPRMIPDNFSTLAEQVGPAVVNIQVEKATKGGTGLRQFQGQPFGMNPFGDERFKHFGKQIPPQERRQGGVLHVLEADVHAPVEEREHLRGEDQRLRAATRHRVSHYGRKWF